MISYEPLRETLKERNMKISDFRGKILSSKTQTSIANDQPVNLSTIEKLCIELKVPIEKVVRINYK
ncbi:helix-turn-helix domain-containing protein [Cytobacillus gottheilii]|uniref:Helix-turn-helix domain-containing protein n=1 Tax=Cytobacillus gottheilii TaxID=859144 RepID=A0ABX8FFZ5_9BACI|nr:helix-turn-helix domain-containing protein [Cytobacillus gottheilii]QVY62948.1 helix-turn-helix domain-containing protein [Cytobacillus gottheilii]